MALQLLEQIKKIISDKQNILLTFSKDGGFDAVASACALYDFLNKFNKNIDVVSENFIPTNSIKFIKSSSKIRDDLGQLNSTKIILDLKNKKLKKINCYTKNKQLHIDIDINNGELTGKNFKLRKTKYKYDLIITLDTPDLHSLGSVYLENIKFFNNTPIINIDHHSNNEHFGSINFTDITVSSTSEIIYFILKKLAAEHIDKNISTSILSGIIAKTKSFKKDNVKPKTLLTASKLIKLGADRKKIVENLYKTRKLSTLKLWGAVLSNITFDKQNNFVYSILTRDDFIRNDANTKELKDIFDEIILNSPDAKIVLVLHETINTQTKQIAGILKTTKPFDATKILNNIKCAGNSNEITFKFHGKTLNEAKIETIKTIKNYLNKISN